MEFEWDEKKAQRNIQKYGVKFETAKKVFLDPRRKEFDNGIHDGEERWSVLGNVGDYTILVVIITIRGVDEDITRIISARRANNNEQRIYYQI